MFCVESLYSFRQVRCKEGVLRKETSDFAVVQALHEDSDCKSLSASKYLALPIPFQCRFSIVLELIMTLGLLGENLDQR